jgi:GNAT superfamily N-acetyltransferase
VISFRETGVDAPDAHTLIASYFASRAETFPPELGAYKPTFPTPSDFVRPRGVFLIASEDGMNVGCGGVRTLVPGRLELKHLWIEPLAQGHGYGRLLLTQLERLAVELGATEIVLDTNASLIAAGSLYRSSGYVETEPYNENPNATHWFRKAL